MGTRGGLLRPRKFEESSGQDTLNRIEVTISHFPARLGQIPIGTGSEQSIVLTPLCLRKWVLHVFEPKCDSAAWSQLEAAMSGRRGAGRGQVNVLVLWQNQFPVASGRQLQHQLALAGLST